jgi:haloacetate dehalogenase
LRRIPQGVAFHFSHNADECGSDPLANVFAVTPEAMAEYLRCYCCSGTIHAACEDYRAAADIDLEMDEADDKAGHKISAPVLALWGAKGVVGHLWDVLATWRAKATSVSGRALDCGHLLPEEQPAEVLAELQQFFRG